MNVRTDAALDAMVDMKDILLEPRVAGEQSGVGYVDDITRAMRGVEIEERGSGDIAMAAIGNAQRLIEERSDVFSTQQIADSEANEETVADYRNWRFRVENGGEDYEEEGGW